MTIDRTLPVTRRPATNDSSGNDPDGSDSGGIVNMGQAFLDVARAAYDNCHHGKNAVEELERRKNRSGE